MLAWVSSAKGDQENALNILKKISARYKNLTSVQNSFIKCYFDNNEAENDLNSIKLIGLCCS